MSGKRRNPRYSDQELTVMVDEIIRVHAQLLGLEQQHTSAAMKCKMWSRIEDRVNAVGHHRRTQDEIRKRWNDLKQKVRTLASKCHHACRYTGGGSPGETIYMTPWEEKVLGILPPEGLYGIEG